MFLQWRGIKGNLGIFCGVRFLQSEPCCTVQRALADELRLHITPSPWRLYHWDCWLGKGLQHGSGLPSMSPLCILHSQSIELKSNFRNIYHTTELHETRLHQLFSTWVTAEMQLEGIQMCAGSSPGVPGAPCTSQPAGCSHSHWTGMLLEGRHHGLMPHASCWDFKCTRVFYICSCFKIQLRFFQRY